MTQGGEEEGGAHPRARAPSRGARPCQEGQKQETRPGGDDRAATATMKGACSTGRLQNAVAKAGGMKECLWSGDGKGGTEGCPARG